MISPWAADAVCMSLALGGPIYWIFRIRFLMFGIVLATATCYFTFLLSFSVLNALDHTRENGVADAAFLIIGWLPSSIYAFSLAGVRLLIESWRKRLRQTKGTPETRRPSRDSF